MDELLDEMEKWSEDDFMVRRAAAAALCEPRTGFFTGGYTTV